MSIWIELRDAFQRLGESLDAFWRDPTLSTNRAVSKGGLTFTIGMIALAAKMAFSDGQVSTREIEVFHQLFDVPPEERRTIARFFDLAGRSMKGFDNYARDLARIFCDNPGMLEDVLDALFAIALADGGVHPRELDYLRRAADIFGFSPEEFERIHESHLDPATSDPYRVLGVRSDCSNDELKNKYRLLVRENHPDRLITRGVPPELIALASAKLASINAAFDDIQRRRQSP